MKLNKLFPVFALAALLAVMTAIVTTTTAAHAQGIDESLPPAADLSISAEPSVSILSPWVIAVQANPIGPHPPSPVRNIRVQLRAETLSPGPQIPNVGLEVTVDPSKMTPGVLDYYDSNSGIWTITELRSNRVAPEADIYLSHFESDEPPIIRVVAEIIGSHPAEPLGFQDNNRVEFWYIGGRFYANGDAGVDISDISVRFPEPGGSTTFTVEAESENRFFAHISHRFISNYFRNEQYDVRVKVKLSAGLTFAGSQAAPSGTAFSATTGIWSIDLLEAGSSNTKSFPVTVSLTEDSLADLPLEKRCLTAEVISAVPWFGSDLLKRENNIATMCLGEETKEPPRLVSYSRSDITLFDFYPCLGRTTGICTADDTLELAVSGLGTTLNPDEIILHIRNKPARRYRGSDQFWSTHRLVDHTDHIKESQQRLPQSDWRAARVDLTVTGPGGGPLPGPVTYNYDYVPLPDYKITDTTKAVGAPFDQVGSEARLDLEFGTLGTYLLTMDIRATHKATSIVYEDSETYTFHVGPASDLEVWDGGANPAVADDQQAYTIMAVNNGPDEAPAVRVTGLPTGAMEYIASAGEYDPDIGVWTIGRLGVGDRRPAGHAHAGPALTLITDDTPGSEIAAEIENTQDYCVRIKTGDTDTKNDLECAGTLPTGYTEHSAAYYDHISDNNSATITARAGPGEGYPGAPSVTVMETPAANILMWQPVERVNGFEVTQYEVQRAGSPWTTLADDVGGTVYVDMNLRPGQLTQYRVRAVNIFGVGGPWSSPTLTGPDAPGDFTAEQLASGAVRLTWIRPDGNGADITGYTIQVSTNAGGSWAGTGARPGADDTSWIHRNLSVGPVRLYRIRASTAHGPGPWAQATSAEVGRPFLIANYDGASRVALSWTMPSGHAVPVQSWELEHSANGVNWSRLATAPASDGMSYTHSGLSPGDFRHYRVRAVTAIGHGPWSEPATAATAAGAPRLTASANGPNEIRLTWTRPAGGEIFEYQIERKTEGIDWVHHAVVYPETGTSWVDAGLTAGGTWSYRVRAISLSGGHTLEGEWSAEASATTDSGGPANAPTGLTATDDGENRIDLSWTAPAAGGGSVTGYRVEHSTDEGESKTWERVATLGNVTSYSHTGLMSGTTHHYRVAAVSGSKAGPFSDPKSATTTGTETTVPGMPVDLRVTGVDRDRVSIAWSPPADDGGARVTGYEYQYLGPCAADPADLCQSGAVRASGTSASIGGLNVAGTYDFMVRAINAVGAGEWSDPVQADIAPEARGKVVVTPSSLTVTEGGSATYRVKLSHEPTQPIQLGLFWEDPDNDLSLALAGYQGMLLLPSNYAPPEGAMWDGWAYRWNVGIPITVEAEEDADSEDGAVVIHHDVWTAPADLLGNPPDWAEDPVYHFMTGPAVKVTVRDND